MRKHLFHAALVLCLVMTSGLALAQTATDCATIQNYTVAGVPDSPLVGQLVSITGTVFVQPGTYNGGTTSVMDATGGVTFYLTGSGLLEGDEVEVVGTVGDYSGEIQLNGVSFVPAASGVAAVPTELTIPVILGSYDHIGSFARTVGTVTEVTGGVPAGTSGSFKMIDATTDTLLFYVDGDTQIDLGLMAVGDTYQVDGPVVNYNGLIEIKPRKQADLVENPGGDTVPVISDIDCANWVPLASDAIVVEANIADDSAVTSALVYYRENNNANTAPGMWSSVAMSNVGGIAYEGTIPGGFTDEIVEFYVEATDDGAQTVTNPGTAPVGVFAVAVGLTSIYDFNTVHPDSLSQANNYNGLYVNVEGIITAGTGEAGAGSKFILQAEEPNPATGSYAFGGMLIYESSAAGTYFQGDKVQVGGMGNEYFGLSQILPHTASAINLVSFSNALPAASQASTRILSDDEWADIDGTGNLGEAWESVWVRTYTSAVADTADAYGEFPIIDKTSPADSLIVGPLVTLAYVAVPGNVLTVEGFMDYAYGARQIVPINDAYIVMSTASGVDDLPTVMPAGGFKGISPNPFNPATKISFVVNSEKMVQLNIYNMRGEKVRTLVQDNLPANTYDLTWDGKSDAGSGVASGTYFARLRIGAEVMQVRKMALVK